jgi:hypothetical protein
MSARGADIEGKATRGRERVSRANEFQMKRIDFSKSRHGSGDGVSQKMTYQQGQNFGIEYIG